MSEYQEYPDVMEHEGLVVGSLAQADKLLEKIKKRRRERDQYIEAAKARIAEFNLLISNELDACIRDTAPLLSALDLFLDTQEGKAAKTQLSLKLPSGKLVRKFPSWEYVYDNAGLLDYVKAHAPEYRKVEESVSWGELKKDLQVVDGQVLRKSTGELVEAISLQEKPARFDVE